MPRQLQPDTGMPSVMAFNIEGTGKIIEGTIRVTDGSGTLPEMMVTLIPQLCESCPELHLSDTLTFTVRRLK